MTTPRTASTKSSSPSVTATTIRVLFVDDNPDMSAVLRMVIDAEPDMRCVGSLTSADRLVAEVRRLCKQAHALKADVGPPLVVVLDATMPGKDPLEAMSELAEALPRVRTIIYSGQDDPGFVERVIDAGAWGFVSKRDEPGAITRAVREVWVGRLCVADPFTSGPT